MKKVMNIISINGIASFLFIISSFCISQRLNATHIVGGNITYKTAGNNKYTIHLTVRRDCFNGDPEAFFDSPASVGIFDSKGKLLTNLGVRGQLYMAYKGNQTIEDPITESLCSIDGVSTVCIHQADYEETIFLPYLEGGYYLEYQRCCRNLPLQNIMDPLEAGASWIVHISEDGQKLTNSTPDFGDWSQIFLCAGRDYSFDHGADDADGDSLVYKMWTPFLGASKAFPKPQPPASPDFNPVKWAAPYNESNMLGGTALRIDSKTGKLSALPNTLGQFLIGVQVEEYRDGKLIGIVYRDFEVKVVDCSNLVDAKIIAPKLKCDDFTVNFKNENVNARKVKWFFDYDRNKNATSADENPVYKYTDTGTYRVALVVTKDSSCFDTAFHIITIKSTSFTKPLYDVEMSNCINGELQLSLINKSIGVPSAAKFNWVISFNGRTINSNQKNPILTVPNGAVITVQLAITEDGDGCNVQAAPKIFTATYLKPEFHFDQAVICVGDSTKIKFIATDSIKGKYNYQWDANSSILSGTNTAEPTITSATARSFYLYVNVDNKNGCTSRDSILIIARPKPKLDFKVENALGSLNAKFINLSDQLSTYRWDFGVANSTTDTSSLRDPSYTFPAKGMYIITLSTLDGCAPSVSKKVNIGGDGLILNDTINSCIGKRIFLNPKSDPKYTYKWAPANKVSDSNIANPFFVVDSPRIFVAELFDALTGVAVGTLNVLVSTPVSEEIKSIKDTVVACDGQPVGLNPNGNNKLKYLWSPSNLLNDATAVNPMATVSGTTTFMVTITNPADTCVLTKSVVVVIPSKIAIDLIPDSLNACNGVPIALNPNGKQDPNLKYKWSPGRFLDDSTALNPKATINTAMEFKVTISDTRFANCMVMKTVFVKIPLVNELGRINDSITVCAGVATGINSNGDARFKYEWLPIEGLDNPNIANPKATVNATTLYTVKITDSQLGNCSLSKTVKVKVPPSFSVETTYKDSTSCTATSFKLGVKSNNPNVKFEWFNGNTSISKLDTVTVRPTAKTVYRVVGTDENGCQKSETVTIDPAGLTADAIAPNNGIICQGDSVRLNVNVTGANQGLRYEWTPANQIQSGANTANPSIKPNTGVTFSVKVTNAQGCSVSDTVTVRVLPVISVTAAANPTSITIGQSSQINANTVPGYTYRWSPIDGLDNPNTPSPRATPKQTTTYTLTATSPDGCVQSRSVTITVIIPECAEPFIFLPNAFTPNGDGKNDELCLRSNIVATMSLIIFNRWGEKVFETRNQATCWDGRFKGKLLNPDVYGYYLTVDCVNGQKFTKKGNVTILR